jgi:hypothetical protein
MDSGAANRKDFIRVGFVGGAPLAELRVLFYRLYLKEMVAKMVIN